MTEPQTPLAALAAALPARLHAIDCAAQGHDPWPLTETPQRHARYVAEVARLMVALSPLLGDVAAYSWSPDARPCGHMLGALPCTNHQPHKGNGLGCVHSGSYVADGHDASEGRATA